MTNYVPNRGAPVDSLSRFYRAKKPKDLRKTVDIGATSVGVTSFDNGMAPCL